MKEHSTLSPRTPKGLFAGFNSPGRQGDSLLPPYSPPGRKKISSFAISWKKIALYLLGAAACIVIVIYSSQKSTQLCLFAEHIKEKHCGTSAINTLSDVTQEEPPVQKVIKVTFAYGKGAIDAEGHTSTMNALRERVIHTHIDHAKRHNHRQIVQRTDLIGNIFTKVATILHIMIDELNKPEDKRSGWIV